MTPAEVLSKARDVLAERGWGQGELVGPSGAVCLMEALFRADEKVLVAEERWPVINAVEVAVGIPASTWHDGTDLPRWNDAPERTYEDVQKALKDAQYLLESRELLDQNSPQSAVLGSQGEGLPNLSAGVGTEATS